MFLKFGDGTIVSVLNEEELTEEQKKIAKDLSKQTAEKSEELESKNSENN
jgi:predicted DNA-binding antitoxin AbrB/MazE fold protein